MATEKMEAMRQAGKEFELKKYIRAGGYSPKWKREAWLFSAECTADQRARATELYASARQSALGSSFHDASQLADQPDLPVFGGCFDVACKVLALSPNAKSSADGSLLRGELAVLCCVIHNEFPEIEYSPQLPVFGAILLGYLTPGESYIVLSNVLSQDKKLSMKWHFTLTRYRWRANVASTFQIAMERVPDVAKHLESLGVGDDFVDEMLKCFLSRVFPFETLVQMTASFIFEGSKVVLRFVIAFLQLSQKAILRCKSAEDFTNFFRQSLAEPLPIDESVSNAFAIRKLKKLDMHRRISRMQDSITNPAPNGEPATLELHSTNTSNFRMPKWCADSPTTILDDVKLLQLWRWLPSASLQLLDAKLVFSTHEHGHNLRVLYNICEDVDETLIVIEDTKSRIFGGFGTTPWSAAKRVGGSGDCFLFSLTANPPQQYTATAQNTLFQICTTKAMQMGGGGDGAGLFINNDLQEGHSHWCETYNNDPLCGEDEYFEIVNLEVWTFAIAKE